MSSSSSSSSSGVGASSGGGSTPSLSRSAASIQQGEEWTQACKALQTALFAREVDTEGIHALVASSMDLCASVHFPHTVIAGEEHAKLLALLAQLLARAPNATLGSRFCATVSTAHMRNGAALEYTDKEVQQMAAQLEALSKDGAAWNESQWRGKRGKEQQQPEDEDGQEGEEAREEDDDQESKAHQDSLAWLQVDALRALSSVLQERSARLDDSARSELLEHLVGAAQQGMERGALDLVSMAATCMAATCSGTVAQLDAETVHGAFDLVAESFVRYSVALAQDTTMAKPVTVLMRAMGTLMSEGAALQLHLRHMDSLMPLLKTLSCYATVYNPSMGGAGMAMGGSGSSVAATSSDSEWSDLEGRGKKRQAHTSRVRLAALQCVAVVARVSAKAMHGYWKLYVPDSKGYASIPKGPSVTRSNLLAIMLHDASPRVRQAAAATLAAMLDGSKLYLSAADDRVSSSAHSFTSLSWTLAQMVQHMHQGLARAIELESNSGAKQQMLKALQVLVNNAPYGKLEQNHGQEVLPVLLKVVTSKQQAHSPEVAVKNVALSCVSALCGAQEELEDVSGIVEVVREASQSVGLRHECAQVLLALAGAHARHMAGCWEQWHPLVDDTMANDDQTVRLNSMRIAEAFAEHGSPDVHMWAYMLTTWVTQRLQDSFHAVRVAALSCCAHLDADMYAALDTELVELCQQAALGEVSHSKPAVRVAACRLLGVLVCLAAGGVRGGEEIAGAEFVHRATEALYEALKDSNAAVRMRACWALAGLCDVEAYVGDEEAEGRVEELCRLSTMMVEVVRKDVEKVRANACRTLGNLMAHAGPGFGGQEAFDEVAEALVGACAGKGVKVRWNAAHALGHALANVQSGWMEKSWRAEAIGALCTLVAGEKNYKVRINAVSALGSVPDKNGYGDEYAEVLCLLIEARKAVEGERVDVKEYRYKASLLDAMLEAFAHVVQMSRRMDFQGELQEVMVREGEYVVGMLEERERKHGLVLDLYNSVLELYESKMKGTLTMSLLQRLQDKVSGEDGSLDGSFTSTGSSGMAE